MRESIPILLNVIQMINTLSKNQLTRRILLGLLPWAIQLLYLPLNRLQSGGIAPALPIDALIPLRPLWVIPYMATLITWIIIPLWAVFKFDDCNYRALIIAELICVVTGISVFFFFPTYVIRPEITHASGSMSLIAWLYQSDQAYNALPSGHAYISGLFMLILSRLYPRQRLIWITAYITILLSTLFTRQHYILDLVAGFALSFAAFYVFLRLTRSAKTGE